MCRVTSRAGATSDRNPYPRNDLSSRGPGAGCRHRSRRRSTLVDARPTSGNVDGAGLSGQRNGSPSGAGFCTARRNRGDTCAASESRRFDVGAPPACSSRGYRFVAARDTRRAPPRSTRSVSVLACIGSQGNDESSPSPGVNSFVRRYSELRRDGRARSDQPYAELPIQRAAPFVRDSQRARCRHTR
jgi:hypothetical protein